MVSDKQAGERVPSEPSSTLIAQIIHEEKYCVKIRRQRTIHDKLNKDITKILQDRFLVSKSNQHIQ